jgi:hypothetical protein
MAGPSIAVRVLGDLSGLGRSLDQAGTRAQGVASRAQRSFGTFLAGVNRTGVLGPFGAALEGINESVGSILENGKRIGPGMIAAGGAVAGVGAILSAVGSKEQAAHQQLEAAIGATGHAYGEYGKQIAGAVRHEEKFGDTAHETYDALRVLTQATHNTRTGLSLMNTVSDVAAAKHIGLSEAALLVGKVYNGNTKLLKQFGIVVDKNTHLTKDGQTATQALAKVVGGQASAAANTFAGRLDAIKARLTDAVAMFGQKYGPALQAAGIAVMALGTIWTTIGPIIAGMELATMWPVLLVVGAIVALIAIGYVLYRNWGTIWHGIHAAVLFVWDWIKKNWPLLLGILLGPIALAVVLIIRNWDRVKAALSALLAWIRGAWNAVATFFGGIASRIGAVFSGAWSSIQNAAAAASSWIRGRFNDVVTFFTKMPGRIASAAAGMWHGISDAFRDMLNILIGFWNKLHFKMPSFDTHIPGVGKIGGFDVGMPKIQPLATGGFITSPGLFYLHAGEAVTPAAPRGPAVNIEHATFSEGVDIDLLMRRVAFEARRQAI